MCSFLGGRGGKAASGKTSETLTYQTGLDSGVYQQETVKVCCVRGGVNKPAGAQRHVLSLMRNFKVHER